MHGYTQRNAAHVGWRDRGVIAPGYLADLNVIDLDSLSLSPPKIVQDLPAGGTRLLQSARGYLWTREVRRGDVRRRRMDRRNARRPAARRNRRAGGPGGGVLGPTPPPSGR